MAFADLAKNVGVRYIVGDWMSEYNMTTRGGGKVDSNGSSEEFETSFLEALLPALPYLESRKIKVAVNAGASDPEKLHDIVIGGDEVLNEVQAARKNGQDFKSLTTGKLLSDWEYDTIYAQCYLGCFRIVEAFKNDAHIVLCGRVADASPTIGCAAYHCGWGREDYEQLAHAFVAGHLIEHSAL
ncbi:hypothetical protein OIDMADRAFT_46733 [Oidiodendron maius Zn]|uniref:Acyclic terpene utilisation N-terminal domain-containing protein n=1 Tax=Oidiodendron maius (strain Zn) TaxID=913774 RepID=A0A0C3HEZ6_OIDMZ|nr:hypothetical protein OIDMADRAFT_46733 [Oidiodendron maius Zn]